MAREERGNAEVADEQNPVRVSREPNQRTSPPESLEENHLRMLKDYHKSSVKVMVHITDFPYLNAASSAHKGECCGGLLFV